MKNLKIYFLLSIISLGLVSCNEDDMPAANNVTLEFNNTFGDKTIVLGDATSTEATVNTSNKGQVHHFSELKYVISNIRLVKANGTEFPYHINDLDKGATVIDQSKDATLKFVLKDIPTDSYTEIKFGLGVKTNLNTLDEVSFPKFYAAAGENDTQMHWEWGTGYRFTKIEGFYGENNDELSFHSGSTVEGTEGDESTYTQGVDAYRDISLVFPKKAVVGEKGPKITIKANFDYLLSGDAHTIELEAGNATPSAHTANNMIKFVDNLKDMFSIVYVEN